MRNKRCIRFVATLIVCMICVSSCSNQQSIPQPNEVIEKVTQTPQVTLEVVPDELDEQKELSIYSMDSESEEKVSVTALVSCEREITPQIIVDKVVESMVDETFVIGIDEVTTSDETVIVSFESDQAPVTNVSSSAESEILDAISMSLLENLPDYHKVIFRVMGEAYQSDNMSLGLNTVYMENK